MLVIRLSRTGRKKIPTYRIVVAEKSAAVKGKSHEVVGHYNPALAVPELIYDKERILHYLSNGAQPSETLARILTKDGFEEMSKYFDAKKKYQKKAKGKSQKEKGEKGGAEGNKEEGIMNKEGEGTEKPAEDKKADEAPAEEGGDGEDGNPSASSGLRERKEEAKPEDKQTENKS